MLRNAGRYDLEAATRFSPLLPPAPPLGTKPSRRQRSTRAKQVKETGHVGKPEETVSLRIFGRLCCGLLTKVFSSNWNAPA